MRTVLFLNASSRKAKPLIPKVLEDFASPDCVFQIIETIIVRASTLLNQEIEKLKSIPDKECVVIGSGDGTLSIIIDALKNQPDLIYGFLPLGTCNDFAINIGLPARYEEAFIQLNKQNVLSINLGEVNERLFENAITIGLPTRVAENISDRTKRYFGQVAFVLSGLKELIRHKAMLCSFETNEQSHTFMTHAVVISNGHSQGDRTITSQSNILKDELTLVAFGIGQSRLRYAYSFMRFLVNRHEDSDTTLIIPFKSGKLTTKPTRKIEADGELISKTPAFLKVKPKAIKVLC